MSSIYVEVLEFQSIETAEAGTDENTLVITGHNLQAGDFIVNTTRRATTQISGERGSRKVATVTDENTLELYSSIAGQTAGDSIRLYKFTDRSNLVRKESFTVRKVAEGKNSARMTLKLTYTP